MKYRMITVILASVLVLSGCSSMAAQGRADVFEDAAATAPNRAVISAEQAEAIALEHAGFTADQVSRLRTEYEIDDGIPRYEVQFRQGPWEYDYEIHAETGAILSYDRDD